MTKSIINGYNSHGSSLNHWNMYWLCRWWINPISLKRIPLEENSYLCDKK